MRCACCPPNLARLVTSVGVYAATQNADVFFIHQYLDMELVRETPRGALRVEVESGFPWDGHVKIRVSEREQGQNAARKKVRDTIALRIPGWCGTPVLPKTGQGFESRISKGYLYISGEWSDETLELEFPMEPVLLQADPMVREDIGKACVVRGPIVYCAEEVDNGDMLDLLVLDPETDFTMTTDRIRDQEIIRLEAAGWRRSLNPGNALYGKYRPCTYEPTRISFIPYFTWSNRGENEMKVWLAVRG